MNVDEAATNVSLNRNNDNGGELVNLSGNVDICSTDNGIANYRICSKVKVMLHCPDGAFPYLTPSLLQQCFPSKDVSDVLLLGIAAKDTCLIPVYADDTFMSQRNEKRKRTRDKVSMNQKTKVKKVNIGKKTNNQNDFKKENDTHCNSESTSDILPESEKKKSVSTMTCYDNTRIIQDLDDFGKSLTSSDPTNANGENCETCDGNNSNNSNNDCIDVTTTNTFNHHNRTSPDTLLKNSHDMEKVPTKCRGYEFSPKISIDPWLVPYTRVTVPTFDPILDSVSSASFLKYQSNSSNGTINSKIQDSSDRHQNTHCFSMMSNLNSKHLYLWTQNGRHPLTPSNYRLLAFSGLKSHITVPLFHINITTPMNNSITPNSMSLPPESTEANSTIELSLSKTSAKQYKVGSSDSNHQTNQRLHRYKESVANCNKSWTLDLMGKSITSKTSFREAVDSNSRRTAPAPSCSPSIAFPSTVISNTSKVADGLESTVGKKNPHPQRTLDTITIHNTKEIWIPIHVSDETDYDRNNQDNIDHDYLLWVQKTIQETVPASATAITNTAIDHVTVTGVIVIGLQHIKSAMKRMHILRTIQNMVIQALSSSATADAKADTKPSTALTLVNNVDASSANTFNTRNSSVHQDCIDDTQNRPRAQRMTISLSSVTSLEQILEVLTLVTSLPTAVDYNTSPAINSSIINIEYVIGTNLPAMWATSKKAYILSATDLVNYATADTSNVSSEESKNIKSYPRTAMATAMEPDDPKQQYIIDRTTDGCIDLNQPVTQRKSLCGTSPSQAISTTSVSAFESVQDHLWFNDPNPIDCNCTCLTCKTYSRSYIYHLVCAQEMAAEILLFVHNLHHFLNSLRKINGNVNTNINH